MGVGYFKPPGEILSKKPGIKSCGFLAVDFWLCCGPQSQLPAEPGTGAVGGQSDHKSLHEGQEKASPGILAAVPHLQTPVSGVHTHQASWRTAAATAVLDSRAAERRVSPFFSLFSLRACCLTKPLVTLDFSSSFCTKCSIITK